MERISKSHREIIKTLVILCAFVVISIASTFYLAAQEAAGRVVGSVTDPSGAVIPGVHVVVTNVGTHVARQAVTDNSGYYQVLALPVGDYTVTAERKGFNP